MKESSASVQWVKEVNHKCQSALSFFLVASCNITCSLLYSLQVDMCVRACLAFPGRRGSQLCHFYLFFFFFGSYTHTHPLGLELTTSPSIPFLSQVTLSHFYYMPPVSIRDLFGFFSSFAPIEVLSVHHVPLSWKSLHSPLCHKNVSPPDSCFGFWIWCSLLCVCPTNFIFFSLSLDAFFSDFFFFFFFFF